MARSFGLQDHRRHGADEVVVAAGLNAEPDLVLIAARRETKMMGVSCCRRQHTQCGRETLVLVASQSTQISTIGRKLAEQAEGGVAGFGRLGTVAAASLPDEGGAGRRVGAEDQHHERLRLEIRSGAQTDQTMRQMRDCDRLHNAVMREFQRFSSAARCATACSACR